MQVLLAYVNLLKTISMKLTHNLVELFFHADDGAGGGRLIPTVHGSRQVRVAQVLNDVGSGGWLSLRLSGGLRAVAQSLCALLVHRPQICWYTSG